MMSYDRIMRNALNPPQSKPLLGREKEMVKNEARGYVFKVDPWMRARRFLILGSEGGTYYTNESKLTIENAQNFVHCLNEDGKRAIDLIAFISDQGLAAKNNPAIFGLALASVHPNKDTRKYAFQNLKNVCRIGTHLFHFVAYREALNAGWGRTMRNAIGSWYTDRSFNNLVLQVLKYKQRNGWSHRDLLRLSHATGDELQNKVFNAICRPEAWMELSHVDSQIDAYCKLQAVTSAKEAAMIISDMGVPREFVPTQFLKDPDVWAALLERMPMTAMIRNLGNMSKAGLLTPLSAAEELVSTRLTNAELLKKARIHPFAVLLAAKTYSQGHSIRGSGQWTVAPKVIEGLDSAFDLSFWNVEPTGKRYLLAVDVSSSMEWAPDGIVSCAEAAAAMSLITARTESKYYIMGFSTHFKHLGITAKDTLPTVLLKTTRQNFGGTDTSVAINWAMKNNIHADVIMVYTDNATWAGDTHTCNAIKHYRQFTGLPVKLGVVAFSPSMYSIRDQKEEDYLSMDFVGLDASLPQAIHEFVLN